MAPKTSLDVARFYTKMDWKVVPVPLGEKGPRISGWNELCLTEEQLPRYFSGRLNVGVLLGEPSGGLLDVDLDHALAVELAPKFLPTTGAIFGRAGKPRSHWLYRSTQPVRSKQWEIKRGATIVELRSTGLQTVFPGSIHPSGEPIRWNKLGEPETVDCTLLIQQIQALYDEVLKRLGVPNAPQVSNQPNHPMDVPIHVVERARKYLSKLSPAISGQRGHNATFHAACTLVLGFAFDREQALQLLREWNESCQPPWSEAELEHKVDDALKQPGWRGYLLRGTPRTRGKSSSAIDRANRHAIQHRLKERRRTRS